MEPTTLDQLMQYEGVTPVPDGICLVVQESWVLAGEDRLSYTTLVRLVECCREYHWKRDVLALAEDDLVDSITRKLACEFIQPISVGSEVRIRYAITNVGSKSYGLRFVISEISTANVYATFDLVSVFYDPTAHASRLPPQIVLQHLAKSVPS